jgi:hypothetical protein
VPTLNDFSQFALQHPDGRWLYNLKNPSNRYEGHRVGMYADGELMTRLGDRSDWWATDREATKLHAIYKVPAKPLRYVLKDQDALSVKYPAELSVEDYAERREDDDSMYWRYQAVTEEQPQEEHVYDGPFIVLEGSEPPGPDDLPWVSSLPMMLTNRTEYLHLMPGYIPGLRQHLQKLIKRMSHVEYCLDNFQGRTGLHVTVKIPFDQPQTTWVRDKDSRGRARKTGRNVPVLVTHSMDLPVPAHVSGLNYAAALTEWAELVDFWTGVITSASQAAACSACGGTGHIVRSPDDQGEDQ